ncbi:MAG: response regulator [Ignavibacteriales bacterium]|nr:response regulator [Ignavibacteriales bacterium]MBK7981270.1 response regulator [Ignavibacteriota bacterium]
MEKAKILVVEDEIIIAMEIAERLKAMGYEVMRIVSNGQMAIENAIREEPDLILMDIMIQGEIDGIETATKIRSFSDIPVIYLTANADDSTLQRAKVSDAFGYLIKPFEERELNTTIEMALYKHKMETKLRENEARFRSLVQNSTMGIFRTKLEGTLVLVNPALVKILGYSNSNELLNEKTFSILINGIDAWNNLIDRIKFEGSINSVRQIVKKKDGSIITVSISGNLIKGDKNGPFFDGTIEDVSLQEQYQTQLIKAKEKAEESDRLKTEFLAGMSHEIRTPINTILSYISLLQNELTADDAQNYKELFHAIDLGSRRLTRTIDSILNMAQFQSGTFETFRTHIDLVDDILQNLYEEFKHTAKQRGLELKFYNKTEKTKLLGDKYSLSQLFVNLIDNGLKYTKEGHVEIVVFNDENGNLSVDIQDTGIGISEEFLPTLFEPFTQEESGYRRKFDGNGLGLALVKKYCELNDAFIKVSSKKGVGTKFSIRFMNSNSNNIYKANKELKNENS